MLFTYFLLFVAIAAEIVATTSLKHTAEFTRLVPTLMVLTLYGFAFYLLSIIVKTVPIGIAYALWSGLGIVGTSIAAYILYNQKLSVMTMVGMLLIIVGVVVMQWSNSVH